MAALSDRGAVAQSLGDLEEAERCYTGALELAIACDIVIAADHAQFGLTEPRVGLAALGWLRVRRRS